MEWDSRPAGGAHAQQRVATARAPLVAMAPRVRRRARASPAPVVARGTSVAWVMLLLAAGDAPRPARGWLTCPTVPSGNDPDCSFSTPCNYEEATCARWVCGQVGGNGMRGEGGGCAARGKGRRVCRRACARGKTTSQGKCCLAAAWVKFRALDLSSGCLRAYGGPTCHHPRSRR